MNMIAAFSTYPACWITPVVGADVAAPTLHRDDHQAEYGRRPVGQERSGGLVGGADTTRGEVNLPIRIQLAKWAIDSVKETQGAYSGLNFGEAEL